MLMKKIEKNGAELALCAAPLPPKRQNIFGHIGRFAAGHDRGKGQHAPVAVSSLNTSGSPGQADPGRTSSRSISFGSKCNRKLSPAGMAPENGKKYSRDSTAPSSDTPSCYR